MIGFFPEPLPDELLYSIIGRYHRMVGYQNLKGTMVDLFGSNTATAVVDLPSRLYALQRALPPQNRLTVDRLIDEHTLLPFLSPFLPEERVRRLREDMCAGRGMTVHLRSGVMASAIKVPSHLRICPDCARQDFEQYGECYWHRVHQLNGIEVCPVHGVWLEATDVLTCNRMTRHVFSAVPCHTRRTPSRPLDLDNHKHQIYLRLATDAQWLLHQCLPGSQLQFFRQTYLDLLFRRDLATFRGRVHSSELRNAFREFYGDPLLNSLQCGLDPRGDDNWLFRLVRTPRTAQHPVRHLLLAMFLGVSIQELVGTRGERRPFGQGPWPCLNPVSNHYMHSVIKSCTITFVKGLPIGAFPCVECGFEYTRRGPDSVPQDRFARTRVKSFGPVWMSKLVDLTRTEKMGLRQMARILGVDAATVKRHLRLASSGPETSPLGETPATRTTTSTNHQQYRDKWLQLQQSHPHAGRSELRRLIPAVFTWLRRKDSEWLEQNSPAPKRAPRNKDRVDWQRRDRQLSALVKQIIPQLRRTEGRPRKLTIASLAQAAGARALIQKHGNRLPATLGVLREAAESREQFAVRRVIWAAGTFENEGICPAEWRLAKRAGLSPDLLRHSEVSDALDVVMSRFTQSGTKRDGE